jgi:hypothetical protein
MTTLTFNDIAFGTNTVLRAPKISFAARLAALQAKQGAAPDAGHVLAAVVCAIAAAVPATLLAWAFVTI